MAERKTQYNKLKKPKLPDSVELEAMKEAEPKTATAPKPDNKPTKGNSAIDILVTAENGLNVREKPIKGSAIVRVLGYNEKEKVLSVNGEWGKVSDGWIMLAYTNYAK